MVEDMTGMFEALDLIYRTTKKEERENTFQRAHACVYQVQIGVLVALKAEFS